MGTSPSQSIVIGPDRGPQRRLQYWRVAARAERQGAANKAASAASLIGRVRLPDRGPAHYLEESRSTGGTILQNLDNPVLTADDVAVRRAIASQFDELESRWNQIHAFCNITWERFGIIYDQSRGLAD